MTIQRIDTGARMSKVVIHGDTVYLAGFTANKALAGGVAEQTAEILSIIDGYLAKAGTDKTKLLRAIIWLSDIRTVDDMNKVWDAWCRPGARPRAPVSKHCCRGRRRR
jgi:enamine deaminase RidA (YjgF/YER057c/UK114 family)